MKNTQRPSADATRLKILKAAKALFLKHGFDGVRTAQIATTAKVHSNLIFHHFKNKETLWRAVKSHIIEQYAIAPNYDTRSAKLFLQSALAYRFALYANNPDLARLVQWQHITSKENELMGNDTVSPIHWLPVLRRFQQQGEITNTYSAEHIMLFMVYSSHAPFTQQVIPFTQAECDQYQTLILQSCYTQFLTKEYNHD